MTKEKMQKVELVRELARNGERKSLIARRVGVSAPTVTRWLRANPVRKRRSATGTKAGKPQAASRKGISQRLAAIEQIIAVDIPPEAKLAAISAMAN